jgi:predicted small integral membrane protein
MTPAERAAMFFQGFIASLLAGMAVWYLTNKIKEPQVVARAVSINRKEKE